MKKTLIIIGVILIVLVVIALTFFGVDYFRVQNQENPIFAIKTDEVNDGGSIIYTGLGYKVIDYNRLDGYDEIKIGSIFMKYEDPTYEDGISDENSILEAVVMEVYPQSLGVMGIKNNEGSQDLYTVSFAQEGNIGFKEGQEVAIYFDGTVAESYPAQIHNVNKIEITKEQTQIEIPEDVIRYYNNSKDNVNINIEYLTNTGLAITITDTNEIPYEFSNDYTLYKEVKNEDYTGQGQFIGENTGNSTAGFTGTGTEYIWEEVEKNPDVEIKDTFEDLVYNMPNMTQEDNFNVIGMKIDWSKLYGELEDGNYRLVLSNSITIEFTLENGEAEVKSQEFNGIF